MKNEIVSISNEILKELEQQGFAIFYARTLGMDEEFSTPWDTAKHPDYKLFLQAAKAADAKMMVYCSVELSDEAFSNLEEQLEMAELPPEELAPFEKRLKHLAKYKGFSGAVQLAFTAGTATFSYSLEAPWYSEYRELREELSDLEYEFDEDEEDDDRLGGFYSRN